MSLLFSRRTVPFVVTTVVFVAAVGLLALLANTGTHTARTVVLGAEVGILLFGLYRFAFERYVGGTIFAIVIVTALLHPAVVRAFKSVPHRLVSSPGAKPAGSAGQAPISDPAGGRLGESAGR